MKGLAVFVFLVVSASVVVKVKGEAGFLPGPPPRSVVLGESIHLPQAPRLRPLRFRPKNVENYVSSDFSVFGGSSPAPPPPPPPRQAPPKIENFFSSQNAISLDSNEGSRGRDNGFKQPFEVVRAPVIYHHTVTDTDVTQALTDAFNVVDNLRKPGQKPAPLRTSPEVTSVEFVNHFPDNAPRTTYATTTTTIVEAPQQNYLETGGAAPSSNFNSADISLTTNPQGLLLPPVPAASDFPPPPLALAPLTASTPTVATVLSPEPVQVLPTTSTSTSPALLASTAPRLIIPSQQHVTTLHDAVQSGNPQVRTIIQPVYIPYPVDANGQPVGPLPDYQSMDFSALLAAQKQLIPSASTANSVSNELFLSNVAVPQVTQQGQQPVVEYQNFYEYPVTVQDQRVAAGSPQVTLSHSTNQRQSQEPR